MLEPLRGDGAEPEITAERAEDDLALPTLASLVAGFFVRDDLSGAEGEGLAELESLTVELPVEIDVGVAGGAVETRISPPTQYTETSVMPVFHNLRLRLVRSHGG